jgi:2,3-dihydroxyphenylpropionate 1,2-dioxygenase
MSLRVICCSHTPLLHHLRPPGGVQAAVRDAFAGLADAVRAFDPELIVVFSPDHYNGFFYDVLPPFCVGAAATAVDDFGTGGGPLNVPADDALSLVQALQAAELDAALSYRMAVDHGVAQPLHLLTGGLERYPVIPLFVNCVARPAPSCRRVRQLGAAVGRWAAGLERRVLLVGSGGLSHSPGLPDFFAASARTREHLIGGRGADPAAMRKREAAIIERARGYVTGELTPPPLNEAWDRAFLDLLGRGELAAVDEFADDWITAEGGPGGHEIRTWIAAFAALAAAGPYRMVVDYYRPVPEWVAGMGLVQAMPA